MTMRIRLAFSKTSAMRFTSHLDLQRALERTFRRARLPIAYTQGFSPHARINLACALPLGFTSEGEFADVWLEQDLSSDIIITSLQQAAPPGIVFNVLTFPAANEASLQSRVRSAEYTARFAEYITDLSERVNNLLVAPTLPRQRRGKIYDLRPLIESLLIVETDKPIAQELFMRLCAREGMTGRPEEVLDQLHINPHTSNIQRVKLFFEE